jgi:hypothetical protein
MLDTRTAFAAAKLQRPGKILGRRLMPYSMGHELLLARMGSPFLTGEAADTGDLLLALEVLQQPFTAAAKALQDEQRMARRIKRRGWWVLKLLGPDWVDGAVVRLRSYLAKGRSAPPLRARSTEGTPTEISILQLVVLDLVGHGWSEAEVWAMPYREAMWHALALKEIAGGLAIGEAPAEADMQDFVKQHLPGFELIKAK